MRALILIACAALSVSACVPTTIGTVPSDITNQTVLDEKAVVTAEQSYKLWTQLVEVGINVGQIKGERAAQIAELDRRIYLALQTVERAYETANAASLAAAIDNFNKTLAAGRDAAGLGGN